MSDVEPAVVERSCAASFPHELHSWVLAPEFPQYQCPGIAEPAPDRQPSNAAVEAGYGAFWSARKQNNSAPAYERTGPHDWMRSALDAAYRVDAPRPAIDRGVVECTLRDRLARSNFSDNLHEPLRTQVIDQWVDVLAGAVLALLNDPA